MYISGAGWSFAGRGGHLRGTVPRAMRYDPTSNLSNALYVNSLRIVCSEKVYTVCSEIVCTYSVKYAVKCMKCFGLMYKRMYMPLN